MVYPERGLVDRTNKWEVTKVHHVRHLLRDALYVETDKTKICFL